MIATGTRQQWERTRRTVDVEGATFHKGEWMETSRDPDLSPTVFLAEQPSDYELLSHFHKENQFQLFVEGGGSIGRQELRPVVVHYAGAYTGYGPVVSDARGLKYFTIRASFDTGYVPLARAREEMPRGPKKHATSPPVEVLTVDDLAALETLTQEVLIPASDGMGAQATRLPAAGIYPVHHLDKSVGCFVFVIQGTLRCQDRLLGPWENVFLSRGEACVLEAGPGGAQLITLWAPPKDKAYSSPN